MPIAEIVPQLFIGDIKGAEDIAGLKRRGITHIVQAMGGMQPLYPKEFTYKVLEVMDASSENLAAHFDSTVKWISSVIDKGGNVFVHW